MTTRKECIYVTCPECGAFRGSQCRNLRGEKVADGRFHLGRARKVGPWRKAKAA